MQKTMTDLKNKLRRTFRDEYKIQWSDKLLDDILFEAQREYALFSENLVGEYRIVSTASPVINLPEDFFQIKRVVSADGRNIDIVSYRYLAEKYGDFRKAKGDRVKYACCNFDGFGKMRIFPQVPENIFVGTVIYNRCPQFGEWDGKNADAIEKYALFQMCQFTGKKQALNYYNEFIDIINRQKRNNLAFGNKNIERTGAFY
jgi:hypothetical protein